MGKGVVDEAGVIGVSVGHVGEGVGVAGSVGR